MPDPDHQETVAALEETWSATAKVLGELDRGAWDLPTDCPGWSVRDHVSHIIGTELNLIGSGSPPPPDPMPAHVRNPIGEANEAWVDARRTLPVAEVLAELVEVTGRRLDELRSMSAERWARPGWSPIGEAPYGVFMQIRVMDCWVHGQDIRWAADRPGDRGGLGEGIALARFVTSLGFVVGRQVAPPDGTTVVFDVVGPIPKVVALGMEGKRASVLDPAPASPTVRLTMAAEHFVRLTCGRESPDEVLSSGEIEFKGDADLGSRIVRAMNIMI